MKNLLLLILALSAVSVVVASKQHFKSPVADEAVSHKILNLHNKSPKVSYFFGQNATTFHIGKFLNFAIGFDMDLYLGYDFPIFWQYNVYN